MKHTPGPWAIGRDDRPGMEWNNHIVERMRPNMAICFMTHSDKNDNSEAEANASLIAAAPDLLEALIAARPWIVTDRNTFAEYARARGINAGAQAISGDDAVILAGYDNVIDIIDAAFAKATGDTP